MGKTKNYYLNTKELGVSLSSQIGQENNNWNDIDTLMGFAFVFVGEVTGNLMEFADSVTNNTKFSYWGNTTGIPAGYSSYGMGFIFTHSLRPSQTAYRWIVLIDQQGRIFTKSKVGGVWNKWRYYDGVFVEDAV